MSLSNYGEGQILDHLFGLGTMTPPTLYVAVSTANPDEDGAGLTEPAGNGYARVATTAASWSRTDNEVSNEVVLTFPEATGAWGTITHIALMGAATGGDMWAYGELDTPVAIGENATLRFPVGDITMTLD